MNGKMDDHINAFRDLISKKGWGIMDQKEIEHGFQIKVTDGLNKLPVNFFHSGKILVQGKDSELKASLTEWANLQQSGLARRSKDVEAEERRNRIAKYLVIPNNINSLRDDVVLDLPGEIIIKDASGPAESYRVEVRQDNQRVTLTQYSSGTLMIQGLSGTLFELVCEYLDQHLAQSFVERATRFIPEEAQAATTPYLQSSEAENEAARWLLRQIDKEVQDFLYPNDQQTLLSAAGVRNAIHKSGRDLQDFSVVVMPFAKAYEGFLIRLATHLGLVEESSLKEKANTIEVANWLIAVKSRLPDEKRYSEISAALEAAWGCRNKAIHSDFVHPFGVIKTLPAAEQEILVMLRAMARAHGVFVMEGVELQPVPEQSEMKPPPIPEFRFEGVDREVLYDQIVQSGLPVVRQNKGRRNVWEINDKPDLVVVAPREVEGLVIIKGNRASEFIARYQVLLDRQQLETSISRTRAAPIRIGVDESGKGDLFGPLVIAGVVLTPENEVTLARHGVKDSKSLSDKQINDLAPLIRELCQVEVISLIPPEYNRAYEEHGRNLNRLLAWAHARIITTLSKKSNAELAISDQFGDEKLLVDALEEQGCPIKLEQRHRAEEDIAVAAASILAREVFISSIDDYTEKAGIVVPRGSSSPDVKKVGKLIYGRWGRRGLERIAKMHFKVIKEIIAESERS